MLPLGFAAFLAFGSVLVLVGANQAALAHSLSLDLSRTGLLGSTLVLGIGIGVVGAGPLVDRHPRRPLWVASMGLAAAALLGFGAGGLNTSANALVADIYPDNRGSMLKLPAGASLWSMARVSCSSAQWPQRMSVNSVMRRGALAEPTRVRAGPGGTTIPCR